MLVFRLITLLSLRFCVCFRFRCRLVCPLTCLFGRWFVGVALSFVQFCAAYIWYFCAYIQTWIRVGVSFFVFVLPFTNTFVLSYKITFHLPITSKSLSFIPCWSGALCLHLIQNYFIFSLLSHLPLLNLQNIAWLFVPIYLLIFIAIGMKTHMLFGNKERTKVLLCIT